MDYLLSFCFWLHIAVSKNLFFLKRVILKSALKPFDTYTEAKTLQISKPEFVGSQLQAGSKFLLEPKAVQNKITLSKAKFIC